MTVQSLLQDEIQDVTGDGLPKHRARAPKQQVVKLMAFFCGMLWMPRGYVEVSGKKSRRKGIRGDKLNEGTTSVENLRCEEQEE